MRAPTLFAVLSPAMLLAGFVLDVLTDTSLVVGIVLSVPIMLSAFVRSRRFTAGMIGAVLIANACAAVENAAQAGEWNVTVLVDGTFSVLAAGLFGVMALRLREVSAHAERLGQSG